MRSKWIAVAALLSAAGLTGCGDRAGDLPLSPESVSRTLLGATLLECPVNVTRSVTDTLGVDGGTIELDGHTITLPLGAVLLPTGLTLTVPEGKYVEVHIDANGQETFEFELPVSIALSYERCTRNNTEDTALTVWHIDEETRALLEHMGGTDDKTARRVTFTSDHLSGFVIAN